METVAERTNHQADEPRRSSRGIGITLILACLSIVVCGVTGNALNAANGYSMLLPFPPILAEWKPHVGWGTLPAIAVALGAWWLSAETTRWGWRRLLVTSWVLGLAWIISLASVDGDWSHILTNKPEYLYELPRIQDPLVFIKTFNLGILDAPGAWVDHVAGHPPAATLIFWLLAKVGLAGGWWAGLWCMLVGSLAAPSIASLLSTLGRNDVARRAIPILIIFPGAVWMGVSADAMFAGISLCGLAFVARGAVTGRVRWSVAGGLLLGLMLMMSYGHLLFGLAVALVAAVSWSQNTRRLRWGAAWLAAAAAVASVVIAFGLAGFWWWDGLALLRIRYYQGIASVRPYPFFVFNNIAAVLVSGSPWLAVAVRQGVLHLSWALRPMIAHRRHHHEQTFWARVRNGGSSMLSPGWAPTLLCLSGFVMIVIADLSGLSKAETERIWLTFALLGWIGVTFLPATIRRWCLATSALWALAVNHLLLTSW